MDIYIPPSPKELSDMVDLAGGQRRAAAAIGINPRTIRKWLAGDRRPRLSNVIALQVAMTQESAR